MIRFHTLSFRDTVDEDVNIRWGTSDNYLTTGTAKYVHTGTAIVGVQDRVRKYDETG